MGAPARDLLSHWMAYCECQLTGDHFWGASDRNWPPAAGLSPPTPPFPPIQQPWD